MLNSTNDFPVQYRNEIGQIHGLSAHAFAWTITYSSRFAIHKITTTLRSFLVVCQGHNTSSLLCFSSVNHRLNLEIPCSHMIGTFWNLHK